MKAIEAGDTFGVALVMVDGKICGLRSRDTRQAQKHLRVNGKELRVSGPMGLYLTRRDFTDKAPVKLIYYFNSKKRA